MAKDYKQEVIEEFESYVSFLKTSLPDELIVGLSFTELVKWLASARKQRDNYRGQIMDLEEELVIPLSLFNDNELSPLYTTMRDNLENHKATEVVSKELDKRGVSRR